MPSKVGASIPLHTEAALAKVVNVFGAARPHHAYLFANRRAIHLTVTRNRALVSHQPSSGPPNKRFIVVAHVGRTQWRNRNGMGGGFEPESLAALVRNTQKTATCPTSRISEHLKPVKCAGGSDSVQIGE